VYYVGYGPCDDDDAPRRLKGDALAMMLSHCLRPFLPLPPRTARGGGRLVSLSRGDRRERARHLRARERTKERTKERSFSSCAERSSRRPGKKGCRRRRQPSREKRERMVRQEMQREIPTAIPLAICRRRRASFAPREEGGLVRGRGTPLNDAHSSQRNE